LNASKGILSHKTKLTAIFVSDKLFLHIVTDLFKAFLGNGAEKTVNVQQLKICHSGRVLLRVAWQQSINEDPG
jgi:hypothetical protein